MEDESPVTNSVEAVKRVESAEEWLKTARKYVPDLSNESEDLVRRLAKCKMHGVPYMERKTCGCSLSVQVIINSL